MVLLHIASVEAATVGGVNIAVPKMVNAQKEFATVGILNLTGEPVDSVPTFSPNDIWNKTLPAPFNKPDFVIFHEVYRPAFLSFARFFSEKGVPYIVIPHGCLTKTAQRKKLIKKWAANLLLFRKFVKNARAIQYLSRREQEQSAFSYPSVVLPNGIELPDQTKTSSASESVKFLYVGRLEWRIKGFDLLLGAIRLQKDLMRQNRATLIVYGPKNDPTRKKLQRMIDRYHISDLVIFRGEVWGEAKKNAFLDADYFIQTSRSEGMPMGLLEALAYGLPVIVSKGTGFADTVTKKRCGIGCKTAKKDIALAIGKVIAEQADYLLFSKNARALIEENFEEKAVARKTVIAYQTLLR